MDGRRIKIKRRRGRLIKTLLIKAGKILQTTALRGMEQSANVNGSAGSQKRLMRSLYVFIERKDGSFSPKKRRYILHIDVCLKIMFSRMFQVLVSSTFTTSTNLIIRTYGKKISICTALLIDNSGSMK